MQSPGDTERIVTAAHCGSSQSQQGVSLPFLQQCQGTTYAGCANPESDAQEHDVYQVNGDVAAAQIRIGSGSNVNITGVITWSQMDVTDTACHQGANTGYSCGTITDKTKSQAITPGADQFVEVTGPTLRGGGGDSGGPYVFGGSALGLHSTGNGLSPPNNLANFGAISFAESNLNVTVKTK